MSNKVRVRFAPSPTGGLHLGGVRTVLYNYLFAKHHGGDFILRIEDTDQNRYVEGAEQYILDCLKWAGLEPDESPVHGGAFGPYRQSERKAMYRQYAEQLVNDGYAYYAFDTPEDLEKMRETHKSADNPSPQYDHHVRMKMRNSLNLTADETKALLDAGTRHVIRIKMPQGETIGFTDMIRGYIEFETSLVDDKVLLKADGMPTYHLANVCDDFIMQITHVIRGEEWLPSAPLHVLLYRYLGWEQEMPSFAHLPLLLKPDGNGKLSKRDGDRLGFPVFPLQWTDPKSGEISSGYRESGYIPEAFINMLALLGWNPGTEQEIFSMDQLIGAFSLERVGKSGSKFSPEKAKWFNHQYIQNKTDEELAQLFTQELTARNINADLALVTRITSLIKERITFTHELWAQSSYFFEAPETYDTKSVKDRWKADSAEKIKEISQVINQCAVWTAEEIKQKIMDFINEKQYHTGQIMNALRVVIVGAAMGADLCTIIEIIGKDETLKRIESGISKLG